MNLQNLQTLRYLKLQGYNLIHIRQVLCKLSGITHDDLADKTNMSRSNVSLTINGYNRCKESRAKLADILEVPVDELFLDNNVEIPFGLPINRM